MRSQNISRTKVKSKSGANRRIILGNINSFLVIAIDQSLTLSQHSNKATSV